MNNSTSAIFKRVISYFSVNVMVSSIAFFSVIAYSHLLSPSEFGLYGEFVSLIPVLTILVGANLSHSVLFFYKKEAADFANYVGSMIVFQLISFLFVVMFVLLAREFNYIDKTDVNYYLFASFFALVFSTRLLCEKIYIARGEVKLYAKLNLLYMSLFSALGVLIVIIYPDHWSRIKIELVLAICLFVYLLVFFSRLLDFKFRFDFAFLFNALAFSIPRIPFSLSIAIMPLIDRQMVSSYEGYSELGNYILATSYSSVMLVAISAITPAFFPSYYDLMDQRDYKKIDLINRRLNILIAVGYLIFSLFINDFASFVSGGDYVLPIFLIPIILTSYLWHSLSSMYCRVFDYKKKTFYLSLLAFFSMMLNVLLNLLLIPDFGILGASFATLIAYFVMAIASYFISRFIVDVHTSPILLVCIGYIFVALLAFLLLMESVTVRVGSVLVIFGVLYVFRKDIFITGGKSC
ncbi:polysaccharide biosynthesis C-terminal domain-containing protein [Vibrio vulnificus]|nr:polysaccharide biosynthesis C-terminal domain-containing protein [Vibrio vulnificus]